MLARTRLLCGPLLAVALAGCGGEPVPPPPDGPAVGMQRFSWTDPERASWDGTGSRPVTATVWYPASEATQAAVLIPPQHPVFFMGHAARNAPLATGSARHPVALLSHGTGGAALQMMWLGRAIAARGYVVVAVDHHGNTAAEPAYDARGFRMVWERIPDLTVALDALAREPAFAGRIDPDDVAAIGFSLGGYTVLGLAGVRTDLDRLQAFCAGPDADGTCEPQGEYPDAADDFADMLEEDPALADAFEHAGNDYGDPRIGRVVAIAPAIGQAFPPEALADVEMPALIVVGSGDEVAPATTNAAYLAEHLPRARLEIVKGAGHYVFLAECTARGRRHVPACDDPEGVDRGDVHARVISAVLEFLARPE